MRVPRFVYVIAATSPLLAGCVASPYTGPAPSLDGAPGTVTFDPSSLYFQQPPQGYAWDYGLQAYPSQPWLVIIPGYGVYDKRRGPPSREWLEEQYRVGRSPSIPAMTDPQFRNRLAPQGRPSASGWSPQAGYRATQPPVSQFREMPARPPAPAAAPRVERDRCVPAPGRHC